MKFLDDFVLSPIPWYRLDIWLRILRWKIWSWWFIRRGKITFPEIKNSGTQMKIDDIVIGGDPMTGPRTKIPFTKIFYQEFPRDEILKSMRDKYNQPNSV